ncbi:MAG: M48 family metallopeptidase [Candidatus Lambdaproteobacteria bacterium]|nr:M48 family metallopeptidase [Candidatus Lambdaproteobacteria bacterium]
MRVTADYSDGRSAAVTPVQVHIAPRELTLIGDDGATRARWPLAEVELVEEVYAGQPPRLRLRGGDAQLTLRDGAAVPLLRRAAPHLRAHLPGTRRPGRLVLVSTLAVAALALALLAALRTPPLLARLVPGAWEQALGERLVTAQGFPWCDEAAGQAVLERLGRELAQGVELPYALHIRVSRTPVLNAVTMPGGQIVVFRDLLDFMAGPDELSAVLAHETAHVSLRHPLQGLIRNVGVGLVLSGVTGAMPGSETLGELGKHLLLLSHGREAELAADRRGMEILRRAGLRHDGMLVFLSRIRQRQGDLPHALAYFSTHPLHEERMALLRGWRGGGRPAMTAQDWTALRGICAAGRP